MKNWLIVIGYFIGNLIIRAVFVIAAFLSVILAVMTTWNTLLTEIAPVTPINWVQSGFVVIIGLAIKYLMQDYRGDEESEFFEELIYKIFMGLGISFIVYLFGLML